MAWAQALLSALLAQPLGLALPACLPRPPLVGADETGPLPLGVALTVDMLPTVRKEGERQNEVGHLCVPLAPPKQ